MNRKVSVAEARSELPQLLRDVESGDRVEITRRGQPVAVLVSLVEFQRLSGEGAGFREAWSSWRACVSDDDVVLPDGWPDALRDRGPGRKVAL